MHILPVGDCQGSAKLILLTTKQKSIPSFRDQDDHSTNANILGEFYFQYSVFPLKHRFLPDTYKSTLRPTHDGEMQCTF